MRIVIIVGALLLVACSPEPDHSTPKVAEEARAALDQAKQVENTLQQSEQSQREQIEHASE
ncbi:hypothetical protein LG204_00855 [Methylovorus menthalis]|uniref:hypothetical protein n=1 Tax=Methylovorus menthalis TaxID=1002227 RepID=UPI001E312EB0|nr:hypothetical protein [Methylovorus menthalis]MCB4809861.1 hypothetical protein [Methylovorus menthalis]